ncbi:ornithine carbamoyltransferase [bacterium]|nr:ornithine carbamoyltransferase [bacterium]MBU3954909.1 ornithine carbamoyltransferase [bacterium]
MKKRDIIEVTDLSESEVRNLFSLAFKIKNNQAEYSKSLNGKILAMIFQKPSTRTRVSFEAGMYQLGGRAINLSGNELQLSRGETIGDTARTLSGYVDAIMIRSTSDSDVQGLAKFGTVPVINGLSKSFHPCQALGDLFTVCEKKGLDENSVMDFDFEKVKLVFVGDSNNVSRSILKLSGILKYRFGIICPDKFMFKKAEFEDVRKLNPNIYSSSEMSPDYIKDAEFIYTDVWSSMGDEAEEDERKKLFGRYQVNRQLLDTAAKNVSVMHCLPARRGQEITDEVMDSDNSIVFAQAHNRMHIQKAILHFLLKGININTPSDLRPATPFTKRGINSKKEIK